jgi:O-antigen/teichoic acid export membrane protein
LRGYLRLTGLIVVTGVVLSLAMPELVGVSGSLSEDVRLSSFVGVLAFGLTPLAGFRFLAEASQRGYLVNSLLLVQSVVQIGLCLTFAWAGWGLTGQALAGVLAALPANLVLCWDGWRRYPDLFRTGPVHTAPAPIQGELWKLNWPTLAHRLCGQLSLLTDNIFVSCIVGPALVAPFYVSQRLVFMAAAPTQILGSATWAALAELYHQQELPRLRHLLIELTRLLVIVQVATLLPAALFTRPFVALWIKPGLFAGDFVVGLAAFNYLVLALLSLWGWLFTGTGLIRRLLPSFIVSTAVNVVVSIGATFLMGLPGPLIGTAAGQVAVSLWWVALLLRKHFGLPLRPLAGAVLGPCLLALPYGAGLLWLRENLDLESWWRLAVAGAVATPGFLLLSWFVLLGPAQRRDWLGRLQPILGRPAKP